MNDDNILQAANYVDGEMTLQEQQDFEQLLQNDAELRQYVAQYTQATAALKASLLPDARLNELKNTLGNLNDQYFKPEAKVVSFKQYARWLSGVAAILILSLVVFNPWRKSLYEQYGTATSMSVTERGSNTQTNLEKAAEHYNKKEFTKAEKLLATEYAADQKNSLAAYYYGITLIETGQETKARQILTQLYNGESAFKYDAAYYIALSYVIQKDNANAKKWLKNIPEGSSNYAKAKELEGEL